MSEHTKLQQPKSADKPSATLLTRDKHLLTGAMATSAQTHQAGIGLGVLGLLVGALTANPLIAVVGFLSGITAGTVFDRNKSPADPVGQNTEPDGERQPATALATASADVSAVAFAADCGPEVSNETPVIPNPIGIRKPPTHRIR